MSECSLYQFFGHKYKKRDSWNSEMNPPVSLCPCSKAFQHRKNKTVRKLLYHSLRTDVVLVTGIEPVLNCLNEILSRVVSSELEGT